MHIITNAPNVLPRLSSLLATGAVAFVVTATTLPAQAQSAADCGNMLTQAIGQQLDSEGFDTSGVCNLTLNQLVQIKSLIDSDGMSSNRAAVQRILDGGDLNE